MRTSTAIISTLFLAVHMAACCCFDPIDLNGKRQGTSSGSDYVLVSSAWDYTCALHETGGVTCWGCQGRRAVPNMSDKHVDLGQCDPPPGQFKAIDTSEEFACGIREDDTVACWGFLETSSFSRVPPSGPFESIAIGHWNSCGVRPGGAVECWGCVFGNDEQRCVPPEGDYSSVYAGRYAHCALDAGGNPDCWASSAASPAVLTPPSQTTFKSLSMSDNDGCGVRTDGTAECWGDHSAVLDGELLLFSSSAYNSCGVQPDGGLRSWTIIGAFPWEADLDGQLANMVSLGYDHGCVITTESRVACFGSTNQGQATPP